MLRARRLGGVVLAVAALVGLLVGPVVGGMRWTDGMRWSADRTRSAAVASVPRDHVAARLALR
jgi:hypothetical protein